MKPGAPRPVNNNLKTAGLIVAIVVVFGFAFFRIAAGPPKAVDADLPSVPVAVLASDSVVADKSLIDVPALPVSAGTDPFRTVLVLNEARALVITPSARRVGPIESSFQPLSGTISPASPVARAPIFVLKGIISGGPDGVAVVSNGAKDLVVQKGALIAPGYRVDAITSSSITLSRGGKLSTLAIDASERGIDKAFPK